MIISTGAGTWIPAHRRRSAASLSRSGGPRRGPAGEPPGIRGGARGHIMLKLSRRALLVGALAPALPWPSWAQSDEIRVISSGGFTAAYKILAPRFEQMTGKKIVSTYCSFSGH